MTLHATHPEVWRSDCAVCRRLAEIRDRHQRLAADPGIVDAEPWAVAMSPGEIVALCPHPGCSSALLGNGMIVHHGDGSHGWIPAPRPRDWSRLVTVLAFAGLAVVALLAWFEWGPR